MYGKRLSDLHFVLVTEDEWNSARVDTSIVTMENCHLDSINRYTNLPSKRME